MQNKILKKQKRQKKTAAKLYNSAVPKLSVFRSSKHIYASLVDPKTGKVGFSVSDKKISKQKTTKVEKAHEVGKLFAEAAQKTKVKKVVFDRSGYLYHGRVKALAEGAREGGLEF